VYEVPVDPFYVTRVDVFASSGYNRDIICMARALLSASLHSL